jgi:hypothetical protein
MNLFSKVGVWILVTAAGVVLPLYELADYTEVWKHDGEIIVPAMIFLFAGMALLAMKRVVHAAVTVLRILSKIVDPGVGLFDVQLRCDLPVAAPSPPPGDLTLGFCALRI